MPRKRFNEDVLKRLLDFCDARDIRFGQALAAMFQHTIIDWEPADTDRQLFYIENDSLEQQIISWIENYK